MKEENRIPTLDQIRAMIFGLAIGDALGVPVEFQRREALDVMPVTGMRANGTHGQPAGTWSDDTSMTLAAMESIARLGDVDYDDIMKNFVRWETEAAFTATDETFDVGGATSKALRRFREGVSALECGGTGEHDNGNGGLMRILPFCAYIVAMCGWDEWFSALDLVDASSLTHAHPRSLVACRIYAVVACSLFYVSRGYEVHECIEAALDDAKWEFMDDDDYKAFTEKTGWEFYSPEGGEFTAEPDDSIPARCVREAKETYSRLLAFAADNLPPRDEIRSSGYVVDTLEAAIWCLLSTDDYRSAVLEAVNLGSDTDTTAAVAGGLAGLAYGMDAIPEEWLAALKKRDEIEKLCRDFHAALEKQNA